MNNEQLDKGQKLSAEIDFLDRLLNKCTNSKRTFMSFGRSHHDAETVLKQYSNFDQCDTVLDEEDIKTLITYMESTGKKFLSIMEAMLSSKKDQLQKQFDEL